MIIHFNGKMCDVVKREGPTSVPSIARKVDKGYI